MRLGKFEKWILVACFKKTVQHDLPDDWRRPRGHKRIEATDGFHEKYLFKSEILLNCFPGLKLSQKQSLFDDMIEKFQTNSLYRKALVTYRRTADQLEASFFTCHSRAVSDAIFKPRYPGHNLVKNLALNPYENLV